MGIRLVERDYLILREIDRWRVITGKQICKVAGFSGQRSCDRRLHKLLIAGILDRKRILYGIPAIYKLTPRGKAIIGIPIKNERVRVEQIVHDMAVLDTAIYFSHKYAIAFSDIKSEKQLHKQDGFAVRKHRPDFVFTKNDKSFCVEVELTMKSKERFSKNIIANFTDYHIQIWVVPDFNSKIYAFLCEMKESYPNIKIIDINEVKSYDG